MKTNYLFFWGTLAVIIICAAAFYLGCSYGKLFHKVSYGDMRELIKKAQIGIVQEDCYVGEISGVPCKMVCLKDGKVIYVPTDLTVKNVYIKSGKELTVYNEVNPMLWKHKFIAYETDSLTNIVTKMSIIPDVLVPSQENVKVIDIKAAGKIKSENICLILTDDYRNLLCSEKMLKEKRICKDSYINFECFEESNQIQNIELSNINDSIR